VQLRIDIRRVGFRTLEIRHRAVDSNLEVARVELDEEITLGDL
jgi:hypothetical protein